MASFGAAIKLPFSSFKKMTIGAVLFIIPIVNFFSFGYVLTVAKSAMKGKFELPEWTGWGNLFEKGLVGMIISFIWGIPAMIAYIAFFGTILVASFTTKEPPAMTGISVAGMLITGPLILLIYYVMPAAVLYYIEEGNFGAGFKFGKIFGKAFTGKWLGAYFLSFVWMVAAALIAMLLILVTAITIIGPLIVYIYLLRSEEHT